MITSWTEKLTRFLYLNDGLAWDKKKKLREYVEDTEDYINIMLDDKQNQLLQMGVVLSTATLMVVRCAASSAAASTAFSRLR